MTVPPSSHSIQHLSGQSQNIELLFRNWDPSQLRLRICSKVAKLTPTKIYDPSLPRLASAPESKNVSGCVTPCQLPLTPIGHSHSTKLHNYVFPLSVHIQTMLFIPSTIAPPEHGALEVNSCDTFSASLFDYNVLPNFNPIY